MKLRNRILIGYLALATLVAALGAGGYSALGLVRHEFENAVLRTQPVLESLQQIRYLATRLTLNVAGNSTGPDPINNAAQPQALEVFDTAPLQLELERYFALVERHFPDEREVAAEIAAYAEELLGDLRELSLQDDGRRHETLHAMINDSYKCLSRLDGAIARALAGEREGFDEQRSIVGEHVSEHSRLFVAGSALAFFFAIIGGWLISRRITRPVERLGGAIRKFGEGALETRVSDLSSDEIGELGRGFDRMAEDLKESVVTRDYVEAVIEAISDGILVVSPNGIVERGNSAMRAMCAGGVDDGPLAGRLLEDLLAYEEGVEKLLGAPFLRQGFECRLVRENGKGPVVAVTASLIEYGERRGGRVLVVRELLDKPAGPAMAAPSAIADHEAVLESLRDGLPKLHWRGRNIGVLLCGVDRLAELVEALGSDVGQSVIVRLGERLRDELRPGDLVGRWREDTLAVILEDVARVDDLPLIGRKLLSMLSRPLPLGQHQVQLAMSIGVACAPAHGLDANTLLACAESAMREARDQGPGRCVLFAVPAKRTDDDWPDGFASGPLMPEG